jgi:hypothetical protein
VRQLHTFYHLLQPRDNFVPDFRTKGSQSSLIAEGCLLENRADLVLADLRKMLASVPKTGPGTKAKRERLTKAIRYIENNLDRMDYQYLRESDLELASGAVEGAVNHVIGLRMDHGGMRWIRERAEALLQLRCIEINGHWDPFIQAVQDEVSSSPRPLRLLRDEPAPLPTLEAVA